MEIKSPSRTRYTHTPATPRLSVLLFCKQSAACPFFVVFARLPTPSRKSPYLLPNVLFSPLAVPSSSYWLRRLFRDAHSSFAASYNDNVFISFTPLLLWLLCCLFPSSPPPTYFFASFVYFAATIFDTVHELHRRCLILPPTLGRVRLSSFLRLKF